MYLDENRSLFLNTLRATEEQLIRCKDTAGPETQAFSWETGLHDNRSSQTHGVYVLLVLKLAEQIQQVQYPVDQEGVASKRFHMAKALVNSSDDLSELCRACGEHSKGPRLTNGRKKNTAEHLAKVVSPAEEANHVFEEFHCSNIGEDSLCANSSVTEPLELVGMDLVGKPTVTDGGSQSLNKTVAGHPKRWDQVLQSTMFGLRTKKQLTTKCSPYYLVFGREARYPSEAPEEYLGSGWRERSSIHM
ncbi:hypothetical protein KUCAC02_033272 [Chaenocephalus aceratus]|nr:hypothetical protein KUCAC02_033272 [Chaenocephalus aceratus]